MDYWIQGIGKVSRYEVAEAVKQITVKQAEALLPWLEGQTQREIAEELGITQPSVQDRIKRALGTIKPYLVLYN